jgi:hypothetical protein
MASSASMYKMLQSRPDEANDFDVDALIVIVRVA